MALDCELACCILGTKPCPRKKTDSTESTTKTRTIRITRDVTLQNEAPARWMISADPIKVLYLGLANVFLNYAVTSDLVVSAGPSFVIDGVYSGFSFAGEVVWRFGDQPLEGFGIGSQSSIGSFETKIFRVAPASDTTVTNTLASAGLHLNYIHDEALYGLSFVGMLGANYNFSATAKKDTGEYLSNREGFVPFLSLRVGYRW